MASEDQLEDLDKRIVRQLMRKASGFLGNEEVEAGDSLQYSDPNTHSESASSDVHIVGEQDVEKSIPAGEVKVTSRGIERRIMILRAVVILLLVLLGAGVSVSLYFLFSNMDNNEFNHTVSCVVFLLVRELIVLS